MALTILAITMALAFQTMISARALAARAAETRRATALLQVLLDATPGVVGDRTGQSGGFDWQVAAALTPSDPSAPAVRTCERSAQAQGQRSHRLYRLSTLEFCRPPVQISLVKPPS